MAKMLLLSTLVAPVLIAVFAAGERHPARALKRAVYFTLAFNLLYAVGALILYPPIAFR
jgi:hypothetical protein